MSVVDPKSFALSAEEQQSRVAAYSVKDGIATISMSGVMMKKDSWILDYFGGVSTELTGAKIDHAVKNPDVKGILLDMDTPGGSTSGTAALANMVAGLADSGYPIYSYVSDICCSAGYWVASSSQGIYTGDTAIVGSIGTYMVMYDTSRAMADAGIDVVMISTGKHKGAGTPGTKITADQRKCFQSTIDSMNSVFLDAVKSGRGYSSEAMKFISTGEVWIGADAVAVGLTDGVGTKAALQNKMAGK